MEAIRTHVAGVDVHKEILAITVLRGKADEAPEVIQFECKTFTEDPFGIDTAGGRKHRRE